MKRLPRKRSLWLLRVGGWLMLVGCICYIIVNRKSIQVHAHLTRLTFAPERAEAIDSLLHTIGLDSYAGKMELHNLISGETRPNYWNYLGTFSPGYTIVDLLERESDLDHYRAVHIVFGIDGEQIGEPVEKLYDYQEGFAFYWSGGVLELGENRFLVVLEVPRDSRISDKVGRPAHWNNQLFFYRILPPETTPVLVLSIEHDDKHVSSLAVANDNPNRVGFQLFAGSLYSTVPAKPYAFFAWDPEAETFILPPPDPRGRWAVLEHED